jgi:hypothetical protein
MLNGVRPAITRRRLEANRPRIKDPRFLPLRVRAGQQEATTWRESNAQMTRDTRSEGNALHAVARVTETLANKPEDVCSLIRKR